MLTALPNSTKFETRYKRLNNRAMDYKAELERLKSYLQTEIDFINDDDALEDRYVRHANKSTLEKVNQILKRGEAELTNNDIGLHLQRVSNSASEIEEKRDMEDFGNYAGIGFDDD